jgi:hypothetical protein
VGKISTKSVTASKSSSNLLSKFFIKKVVFEKFKFLVEKQTKNFFPKPKEREEESFVASTRVARFFLAHHTKTGKINQITVKYTK